MIGPQKRPNRVQSTTQSIIKHGDDAASGCSSAARATGNENGGSDRTNVFALVSSSCGQETARGETRATAQERSVQTLRQTRRLSVPQLQIRPRTVCPLLLNCPQHLSSRVLTIVFLCVYRVEVNDSDTHSVAAQRKLIREQAIHRAEEQFQTADEGAVTSKRRGTMVSYSCKMVASDSSRLYTD